MSTPYTTLTKIVMLLSVLIFSNQNLQAQTTIGRQKVEQFNSDPWGGKFYALTWLPADYHSNTNKYPIIIYLHGSGENGTGPGGLYSLLNHSLPAKISQGWDPQAINPVDGQNYKFIVVSPQAAQWSPNFHNLQSLIPDIIARYRVDPSRIYVTGVSAGGAGTWATVTNGSTFAQQFAAVVPVAAAGTNTSSETTQIPLVGGTYGVKVWNICGTWDSFWTLANNFTNQINSASPSPAVPAVVTGLPGGHEWHVWNTTYDPNWRANAQNKNIYEWMLQYTRGVSAPAPLPLPNPIPLPLPAAATSLPGKVESESFSLMQGIQTEGTSDAGGGQNVGYIDNGDWMEYLVNPTSTGAYTANIRIATPNAGGTLQIRKADGTALATVTIPVTGGWQTWQTVSVPVNFTITGNQSIRVVSTAATNWNINWIEFVAGVTNPTPTPTPPPPTSTAPTSGRVQAESHSAQSGTQKEGTADAGGGENVGWIDNGDWMEYVINPTTTGNYTFSFRLASTATGGQLAVKKADGSTLATVNVPNTGGWQTWQTATGTVALTAGQQTIRIQSVNVANWNINWFEFAPATTTTPPPPPPSTPAPTGTVVLPGKVEAEAYTNMYGIQTENTNDNGGGLNVGWIDYMDWMEYSVDAGAGGMYTVDFRIATPNTTAKVEILNGAGQVISTMNLQSTGGYQSWQNATTTINLAAGVQTIRFRSVGGGAFNINYINFTSNAVTAARGIGGETETEKETVVSTELAMQVYPNPVVSQMVMKLNNNYKGEVILEVIGMDGAVKQAQRLQKSNTGAAQFYLSLSKLQAGNYVVRVVMGSEVVTKTIVKR